MWKSNAIPSRLKRWCDYDAFFLPYIEGKAEEAAAFWFLLPQALIPSTSSGHVYLNSFYPIQFYHWPSSCQIQCSFLNSCFLCFLSYLQLFSRCSHSRSHPYLFSKKFKIYKENINKQLNHPCSLLKKKKKAINILVYFSIFLIIHIIHIFKFGIILYKKGWIHVYLLSTIRYISTHMFKFYFKPRFLTSKACTLIYLTSDIFQSISIVIKWHLWILLTILPWNIVL